MKKLFLLFLLTFSTMLFAKTEYSLNYPVNDYANVLSESEKNTLSEKLMNEYKKSNTQIAILTIPSLEGQSIVVKINDGTTQMTKENGELVVSKTSVTMTGTQMREYSKLLEQV